MNKKYRDIDVDEVERILREAIGSDSTGDLMGMKIEFHERGYKTKMTIMSFPILRIKKGKDEMLILEKVYVGNLSSVVVEVADLVGRWAK